MTEKPIFTFPGYQRAFDAFLDSYTFETLLLDNPRKKQPRKAKAEQVCRFCGRNGLEVKFKNQAHLIPHLLGNQHLVSDFECDGCNLKFSAFENDLANFLGLLRTVQGVKGKGKIPTFKSPDKVVEARHEEFLGIKDGIKIQRSSVDNDAFNIQDELGLGEVTVTKHPYTPIKVYKAFLKMALSVLDEQHVSRYRHLFALLNDEAPGAYSGTAGLVHHVLPGSMALARIHCFMFRKIDPQQRQMTHQFYLRFQNNVFILALPLHQADIELGLFTGSEFEQQFCPPVLFSEVPEDSSLSCRTELRDMSSIVAVREPETVQFRMPPGSMGKTVAIDLKTGKESPADFNPNDIIGIFLAPTGSQLQFPEQDGQPSS